VAADYDRNARIYDRLIGNRLYNRLVWGTSPQDYEDFATEALASADGPFLDAGCGTLVFTAGPYAATSRPLTLVDDSQGMLDKAAERLGPTSADLRRADLFDLPFQPGGFATVACHGVLHVLAEPWKALAALRAQVAPGGTFFASMLVRDRVVGRTYLELLHHAGEVGSPRTQAELAAAARDVFGDQARVTRTGSMAWLRATG
jgi:SAM-dependent methyltransferase